MEVVCFGHNLEIPAINVQNLKIFAMALEWLQISSDSADEDGLKVATCPRFLNFVAVCVKRPTRLNYAASSIALSTQCMQQGTPAT